MQNGELVKYEDVMTEEGEDLEPLSAIELLRHILMSPRGEQLRV